jgi:glutamate-ammonia-ligase adenylyltransferase
MSQLNIIDADLAESVAAAYREYRHTQHMLKLQGAAQLTVDFPVISHHVENVTALWNKVFA